MSGGSAAACFAVICLAAACFVSPGLTVDKQSAVTVAVADQPVSCEIKNEVLQGQTCEAPVIRAWLQDLFDHIDSIPIILFPESSDEILQRISVSVKNNYSTRTLVSRVVCSRAEKSWEFFEISAFFDGFMVKDFPFEEVVLVLRNVTLDPAVMGGPSPERAVKRMDVPILEIKAEAKKVSRFFIKEGTKFGIHLPGMAIEGGTIKVSGRLKILWCDMVVATDLKPEANREGKIYFRAEEMKVAGIGLPRFVVGKIMKTFNPVMSIVESKVPFGLLPSSFEVSGDRLVISSRGPAVIPTR